MVNIHDKTVGCIVDAVTQVMRINRDQIQPPPLGCLAVNHQYLAGLAKLDDRLLIILDIEKLFEAEELATPCSAASGADRAGERSGPAQAGSRLARAADSTIHP